MKQFSASKTRFFSSFHQLFMFLGRKPGGKRTDVSKKIFALGSGLSWCTRLSWLSGVASSSSLSVSPLLGTVARDVSYLTTIKACTYSIFMASSRALIERVSTSIAFGSFCGALFHWNGQFCHPVFCCPRLSRNLPSMAIFRR